MRPFLAFVLIAASVGAAGCLPRPPGTPAGWPRRADLIVDGSSGAERTFAALIDDLAQADVVFVGEDHDNRHHHRWQHRIADALIGLKPDLALGIEMLPWSRQEAVDRFTRGEIDLDVLAAATEWKTTWGFPIRLYAPLFELARDRKGRIFALNAPEPMVRRLSQAGLDGLAAEERSTYPEMDLENAAHREFVREAFRHHHALPEETFRRFYAVQVLWDETMAERTVLAMRTRPGEPELDPKRPATRPMMVIAGTGHLIRRMGIPSRVERRVPGVRTRVVLPIASTRRRPADLAGAVRNGDADWLLVTPAAD